METVKKVLYFAVGIILTVSFIALGMSMYDRSKDTIMNTQEEYDSIINRFSYIEYSMYETAGSRASGSEVVRIINSLDDENVTIYVKNGSYQNSMFSDEEGVAYNCSDGNYCGYGSGNNGSSVTFDKAKELITERDSTMFYINPSASFAATVFRDRNGMIDHLTFVQK